MTAVYLVEWDCRMSRVTTFTVDACWRALYRGGVIRLSLWIANLGFQQSALPYVGVGPADAAGGGSSGGEEMPGWCPMNCEKPATRCAFRNGRRRGSF